MIELNTKGYEFNETLNRKFKYAYHNNNTVATASVFGDLTDPDNLKLWEAFNGSMMIALRWGLAMGQSYNVELADEVIEKCRTLETDVRYKSYGLNTNLTINIIVTKVSENQLIVYGLDTVTNHGCYGIIDTDTKSIETSANEHDLLDILGIVHTDQFFKYLSGGINK